MMNTLDKITNNLESFSKSERKVAEVILASPQTAIHSSIATLAKLATALGVLPSALIARFERAPDGRLAG